MFPKRRFQSSVLRHAAFLSLLVASYPTTGCFWHERRRDVYVEPRRVDHDERREIEHERHEERREERREER